MQRVALGLAACVCVAMSAVAQPGGGGPPPANVRLDDVRQESVVQMRDVTGEIRAVQRSRVAAEEPGLVVTLTVEPGDQVKAGQVIATLDDALMKLELAQRESEIRSYHALVKEREAQVKKAERDLSRLRELMQGQGASQNEVDDADTALAEAAARQTNAQAELAMKESLLSWTRQRLEDMQVRVPFDGRVVSKSTEVGQWVQEGDTVAEIVATGEVDAWIDVPERFIGALSTSGAKVQLYLAALDQTFDAGITAVIADGDRLARTFPVRLRLANPDGLIKPGMSVVGKVPTGALMQAMTISKDAVLRSDTGAYVYADVNGAAVQMPVTILFGSGNRLVVQSPMLQAGMRVVIEGNERIYFPGMRLQDADAPSQPREAAAPKQPGGQH